MKEGGVRQRSEGSDEGGRGQMKEGGVRMILTSFLVLSVQALESQTSKTENVSSIYTSTFRVSFLCTHTYSSVVLTLSDWC